MTLPFVQSHRDAVSLPRCRGLLSQLRGRLPLNCLAGSLGPSVSVQLRTRYLTRQHMKSRTSTPVARYSGFSTVTKVCSSCIAANGCCTRSAEALSCHLEPHVRQDETQRLRIANQCVQRVPDANIPIHPRPASGLERRIHDDARDADLSDRGQRATKESPRSCVQRSAAALHTAPGPRRSESTRLQAQPTSRHDRVHGLGTRRTA